MFPTTGLSHNGTRLKNWVTILWWRWWQWLWRWRWGGSSNSTSLSRIILE